MSPATRRAILAINEWLDNLVLPDDELDAWLELVNQCQRAERVADVVKRAPKDKQR